MAYVKCHDCQTMVHFKPVDIVDFDKKFVQGNEPIYCLSCYKKRMENKSLDEITDEILKLYDEGKDLKDIAKLCLTSEALVASILVQTRDVYFR